MAGLTVSAVRGAVLFALAMLGAGPAAAQDFPSRSVRLVVGFPAGGGVDLVARHVGEEMGKLLGQRVIVENRPGAGGNLAAAEVARAPADGHTLLMGNIAQLAINPGLYRTLPFDPDRDFAPIGQTAVLPFVAVIHRDVPASTMAEVVAMARERPGALTYASAGAGSLGHLAVEMLKAGTGVNIVHVPYRGAAPAVNDLVAGHVRFMIDAEALLGQHVRSGGLKGLAVMSRERAKTMPEVPTAVEAGFPDLVIEGWQGLVAPAGVPQPVLDRLTETLKRALEGPELRERLTAQSVQPAYLAPAAFGELIRKERARWGEVIEKAGAKVE